MNLKSIILDDDTRAGRLFDLFIQSLIIVSLISFSLETVKGKSESYYHILDIIETITVIIFTIEYLLRVILIDKKLKFIFSFFGLVDLFAILPFYLSTGLDLRSLRALRLLRLFKP
ncbi:MAG: ion transporter [Crocinitomicaceae bacterium]|nr:ion transporter [Crocinitomicaceae bacterium]